MFLHNIICVCVCVCVCVCTYVCIIRTSYFVLIMRTNISAGHVAMRQPPWGTSAILHTACDASLLFRCIYAAAVNYTAVDGARCYHGGLCCCRVRQCISLSYRLTQHDFPTWKLHQPGRLADTMLCAAFWSWDYAYRTSLNTSLLINNNNNNNNNFY